MLKREYGRIINVSFVYGLRSSVDGPHYVGYAASKAGKLHHGADHRGGRRKRYRLNEGDNE
jgi:hypothetical protein